jgi:hypothetical protein
MCTLLVRLDDALSPENQLAFLKPSARENSALAPALVVAQTNRVLQVEFDVPSATEISYDFVFTSETDVDHAHIVSHPRLHGIATSKCVLLLNRCLAYMPQFRANNIATFDGFLIFVFLFILFHFSCLSLFRKNLSRMLSSISVSITSTLGLLETPQAQALQFQMLQLQT